MCFVSSHTKPLNCSEAQQQSLGQAAEAELQKPVRKLQDGQPEEKGLAVCWKGPAGMVSQGNICSELSSQKEVPAHTGLEIQKKATIPLLPLIEAVANISYSKTACLFKKQHLLAGQFTVASPLTTVTGTSYKL